MIEERVFSQYGEDGVLFTLLQSISVPKTYFEFGVQDGVECITRILNPAPASKYKTTSKHLTDEVERKINDERLRKAELRKKEMHKSPWMRGWKGIQLDGDHENPAVGLYKEIVTIESITGIIKKYGINQDLGVLSIDIDYNDLYVARVMFDECKLSPAIVVAEFNPILGSSNKMVIHDSGYWWKKGEYMGNSIYCVNKFYSSRGYVMVYATWVNAFFIKEKLAKPHSPHWSVLFQQSQQRANKSRLVEKNKKFITGSVLGRQFVSYETAMSLSFIKETQRVRQQIDKLVLQFPHIGEMKSTYKKDWNKFDKLLAQLHEYLRTKIMTTNLVPTGLSTIIIPTLIVNSCVCITRYL